MKAYFSFRPDEPSVGNDLRQDVTLWWGRGAQLLACFIRGRVRRALGMFTRPELCCGKLEDLIYVGKVQFALGSYTGLRHQNCRLLQNTGATSVQTEFGRWPGNVFSSLVFFVPACVWGCDEMRSCEPAILGFGRSDSIRPYSRLFWKVLNMCESDFTLPCFSHFSAFFTDLFPHPEGFVGLQTHLISVLQELMQMVFLLLQCFHANLSPICSFLAVDFWKFLSGTRAFIPYPRK